MSVQPFHDYVYYIALLRRCELSAFWYAVPLLQAVAATAASGMLGYERWKYAMTHRSLFPVVGNVSRGKPLGNYLPCTLLNLRPSLFVDIFFVLLIEIER